MDSSLDLPDFLAMSQADLRLMQALEAAQQGVWDMSLVNDDAYYSPVWWHMRGYEPDAPLDNSLEGWLLRVHPDDVDTLRKALALQNHKRGTNNVFEYREQHANGHYIWIQSRGRAVEWDENGEATRVVGTDTDISREKQLELDVASERQRFSVMLGSIADAVIATDLDGQITYLNPRATALLLRAEADCLGKMLDSVAPLFDEGLSSVSLIQECRSSLEKWGSNNLVLRVYSGISRNVRCVVAPLEEICGVIQGFIVVIEDVTQSRQMERRLAFMANHDPLTRLPNRHAFEVSLEQALTEARDANVVYSLCCIDLDRFKQINDSLGHAAGDQALQQVVAVMNQWKQAHDYIARVGGDEFVILMKNTTAFDAEQRVSLLEEAVDAMRGSYEGKSYQLGMSYGIAQIRGAAVDAHSVLRLADSRCYAHKNRAKPLRSGQSLAV